MPYEYRKMTQKERREVVQARIDRGYPRHAPPHPYVDEGTYLITATCYNHAYILNSHVRRTGFEIDLLEKFGGTDLNLVGWVILPNHYHILVEAKVFQDISIVIQRLHGVTSRKWNLEDDLVGKRQCWYSFTDRKIRNERHLRMAMNYLHFNPVKHGYVDDPYVWIWSSLGIYLDDWGREKLRENWKACPTGKFGEGWDDL